MPENNLWKRDIPHPAFPQLERDVRVWRYTDLAKFLWSLSRRALYLCRANLLPDRFEGSVPVREHNRMIDAIREASAQSGGPLADRDFIRQQIMPQQQRYRLAMVRSQHVNCWRQGDESEAMWRLYCGPNDGIAMVTTYGRLNDSLTDPAARLAAVRYIDYSQELLPDANFLQAITHKRKAFVHEQEVRIVRWLSSEWEAKLAENPPEVAAGIEMRWDAEATIESIVVSPYADKWYVDAVRAVVERFSPALAGKVIWSDLRQDPVF